ncbi:hypothetical protein MJ572_05660 [Escherichia coli]|nr:hypothetical protein MJ572_05660 [Escherichia coli]
MPPFVTVIQHCSLLAVLVQFALRLAAGLSPVLCVELALPEQLVQRDSFFNHWYDHRCSATLCS